jgi:hypothetical protein
MNDRLKELVRQAKPNPNLIWEDADLERFAELVRAEEREACATECWEQMKLIPKQAFTVNPYQQCANAIRARGEK